MLLTLLTHLSYINLLSCFIILLSYFCVYISIFLLSYFVNCNVVCFMCLCKHSITPLGFNKDNLISSDLIFSFSPRVLRNRWSHQFYCQMFYNGQSEPFIWIQARRNTTSEGTLHERRIATSIAVTTKHNIRPHIYSDWIIKSMLSCCKKRKDFFQVSWYSNTINKHLLQLYRY